jgi:hypothetical protein
LNLFFKALGKPFPLVALFAGVLCAAALHNAAGLAVLGLCVAASVVYAAGLSKTRTLLAEEQVELDYEAAKEAKWQRTRQIEVLDEESRVKMKRIVRHYHAIREEVEAAGSETASPELADIMLQTGILVDRGMALAKKRVELLKYLIKTDPGQIQADIDALKRDMEGETDGDSLTHIKSSIQAREEELANVAAIQDTCEHILHQLESTAASFAGLESRFIKVRSSNIDSRLSATTELRTHIGGLSDALSSVETTVSDLPQQKVAE